MPAATPTPTVGQTLPRVADAYMTPEKLRWILAKHGHGHEWMRVFRIEDADAEHLWTALVHAVRDAPIFRIIDRGTHGTVCGVAVQLTLNKRTANVTTSWHYATADGASRLVTAYPTI